VNSDGHARERIVVVQKVIEMKKNERKFASQCIVLHLIRKGSTIVFLIRFKVCVLNTFVYVCIAMIHWISGVNFINVLCTAFTRTDPKSVKLQISRQSHFTLLGSARVKAAQKTLMKLTPG
jgi:hypothetical protein